MVFVDVKQHWTWTRIGTELRSCVKVEVDVICRPYGVCGRKATLNINLPLCSDSCTENAIIVCYNVSRGCSSWLVGYADYLRNVIDQRREREKDRERERQRESACMCLYAPCVIVFTFVCMYLCMRICVCVCVCVRARARVCVLVDGRAVNVILCAMHLIQSLECFQYIDAFVLFLPCKIFFSRYVLSSSYLQQSHCYGIRDVAKHRVNFLSDFWQHLWSRI